MIDTIKLLVRVHWVDARGAENVSVEIPHHIKVTEDAYYDAVHDELMALDYDGIKWLRVLGQIKVEPIKYQE